MSRIQKKYQGFHVHCWPAQPGNPLVIRVASVIGFSVLYSLFAVLRSLFSVCYIFSNPTAVAHCINDRWI